MRELLGFCTEHQDEIITLARQLVELESPSADKAAADRCGEFLTRELVRRGAVVTRHPKKSCGDQIEARFLPFAGTGESGSDSRPVMLLGHYDTVWEVGTLARRPWRHLEGRLYGPGVFDMKSGIALMLLAVEALKHVHGALPRPVTVCLNADEEAGSTSSRELTESLARQSVAVLVAEPAAGTAVKTGRKGTLDFRIKVTGVAAHAGLDFTKGQNAIVELARQIEKVTTFTDLQRGLTVNVGYVHGGTPTANVVPPEAVAEVDVRIPRLQDGPEIEARFFSLEPFNPQCKLEVIGGINRPPLERTPAVAALYEQARKIARELGFELREASVGGGSDGNFTGALGVPTLDGLGAVGEGAHAENESVIVEWLPKRAALLAALIMSV
jgi:glutamate carboxypeptidase